MKSAAADAGSKRAAGRKPVAGNRGRRFLLKWGLLVVTIAIAVVVDLVTKRWAEQHLALGETRQVLPFLSFERTANSGVAFGMLGGNTALIVVTNVIAMLVICLYVVFERHPVLAGIAGGAAIGGSLGNMIQRLSAGGHVTDFMKFPHWPNFNVADICIDAGIAAIFIGLVVQVILGVRADRRPSPS